MKKEWSANWKRSVQPRKQRKYLHNAPLHARRKLVSAHMSPELRKRYQRRSIPVRKGDEVKVMVGKFRGLKGVVERVNLKESKVYLDNVKVKKVDGSEVMRALRPSNLMITSLNTDDKMRMRAMEKSSGARAPKAEEAKK